MARSFLSSCFLVASVMFAGATCPVLGQELVDFRGAIALASDAVVSVSFDGDEAADPNAGQVRQWMNGQFPLNQLTRFNVDRGRSGFAVSASAIVTTLPASVKDVTATDRDGNNYAGKVVARDNVTELCVVQLEDARFVSLVLGQETAQAGLPVVATSLRNGASISDAGMVASDPIASEPSLGFTPSIDFGGSNQSIGSPVVDSAGTVVGVLVRAPSGTIECLPASQIARLVDSALADQPQDLKRAIVGIQFEADDRTTVVAVSPGSPAAEAGLLAGDQVLKVGSYKIRTASDVVAAVAMSRSGDTLTVRVKRGAEDVEKTVTLREHPQQVADSWQNRIIPPVGGGAFQLKDGQLVPLELNGMPLNGGNFDWQELLKDPNFRGSPNGPLIIPNINPLPTEQSDLEGTLQDLQKRIEDLNERLKSDEKNSEQP